MSGPTLYLGLPPRSLFKFPPDAAPPAIAPHSAEPTIANPFNISNELFNAVLSPTVPLTIAAVYATTVSLINAYNRKHGNKAWGIAKTRPFKAFVILHNVFLAVYSFVTCLAMIRALKIALPGLGGQDGVVETVDALCKIQGPRGLGDAAIFNATTGVYEIKNRLLHLGANGNPDPTDVGRLWNEGLGFWGWWFYLSKFYEVLDTLIILAKGKRSSTLQTYHHAGAMLCMWSGIRFMSPPIWLFVTLNSGIHAMMYTYYTVAALRIRVPQALKRSLTTMQITQFVVGATFAGIHLFVAYSMPVSTPYTITKTMSNAATAVSSAASSASAEAVASAAAAGVGGYLKKLAFRAAGEEGLAENVDAPLNVVAQKVQEVVNTLTHEVKYRNEYQTVNCIDTTGQSFAIWLNLAYLFPLTVLFVRFFIKSYIKRTHNVTANFTSTRTLTKATEDAAHGVGREIDSFGKTVEETIDNLTARLKHITNDEERERLKREVLKDLSQYKANIGKTNGSTKSNGTTKATKKKQSAELRELFDRDAEAAKKALEERVKKALHEEHLDTAA